MSSSAINLLIHLSFISQIIPGYKINVKSNSIVEAESSFGSIFRYMYGESRKETITYIGDIITKVIEIAPKEDHNTQICLIDALRKSIEGINNLKATYENDIYYLAKLSSEILRIEHFIKGMCEIDKC